MKLSLVITAKDKNDLKLADLLSSIEAQDFPKDEMEVLVITEGTSESAKAIGIRKAKGEVIGILASDNQLTDKRFLSVIMSQFPVTDAAWPSFYYHCIDDDVLNRYFALIGGNDPLAYYMGKNDRLSHFNYEPRNNGNRFRQGETTVGDNGFFIKRNLIERTDLDNYYHVDNALEAINARVTCGLMISIWHKTGGNIFSFFRKRYRYGLQHAFNKNRRWHLVDFRQPKDIVRLIWFIICSVTFIQPLLLSLRGYSKIRDGAWFLHPIICFLTLVTYGLLTFQVVIKWLFQSLSAPMAALKA